MRSNLSYGSKETIFSLFMQIFPKPAHSYIQYQQ